MLSMKYLHIIEVWFVGGKPAKFQKIMFAYVRLKMRFRENGMGICKRRYYVSPRTGSHTVAECYICLHVKPDETQQKQDGHDRCRGLGHHSPRTLANERQTQAKSHVCGRLSEQMTE